MNRPLSYILHSQYLFIPLTSKYGLIKALSVYARISLALYWIVHQQLCHLHVWFRNLIIIIIIMCKIARSWPLWIHGESRSRVREGKNIRGTSSTYIFSCRGLELSYVCFRLEGRHPAVMKICKGKGVKDVMFTLHYLMTLLLRVHMSRLKCRSSIRRNWITKWKILCKPN